MMKYYSKAMIPLLKNLTLSYISHLTDFLKQHSQFFGSLNGFSIFYLYRVAWKAYKATFRRKQCSLKHNKLEIFLQVRWKEVEVKKRFILDVTSMLKT